MADLAAEASTSTEATTSEKKGENDDNSAGGKSPETCPICLSKTDNKAFSDTCFHTFCFACLLEWSKVKSECPLCKKPFQSIIHNVRSLDDYDRYTVPPATPPTHDLLSNSISNDGQRFRYRTTLTRERFIERMNQLTQLLRRRQEAFPYVRMYGPQHEPMPFMSYWDEEPEVEPPSVSQRRRIYAQQLRVKALHEWAHHRGRQLRFRNISPDWFNTNQACTHRLVPWLHRELRVLLDNGSLVDTVVDHILTMIRRHPIDGRQFRARLVPYLGSRADHFIHEFVSFAQSPYDMTNYDTFAEYDEPVTTISSSSSDDDDEESPVIVSDIAAPSHQAPSVNQIPRARTPTELVFQAATSLQNESWSSPDSSPERRTPIEDQPSCSYAPLTPPVKREEIVKTETISHESDSDIEIIGFKKPLGDRTPPTICLSSDGFTGTDDELDERTRRREETARKKKRHKRRSRSRTRSLSSDSESRHRTKTRTNKSKHHSRRSRSRSRSSTSDDSASNRRSAHRRSSDSTSDVDSFIRKERRKLNKKWKKKRRKSRRKRKHKHASSRSNRSRSRSPVRVSSDSDTQRSRQRRRHDSDVSVGSNSRCSSSRLVHVESDSSNHEQQQQYGNRLRSVVVVDQSRSRSSDAVERTSSELPSMSSFQSLVPLSYEESMRRRGIMHDSESD